MKSFYSQLKRFVSVHRVGVALTLIMLLAVFFRFWRLWNLPPGLYEDEAANGLDIVNRIFKGDLAPFYSTNNGREALFFFIQAPFVKIFGPTALALRLPAALISLAVVPATYLWVKEWFSRRTALLTALFVATGGWAVSLGRLGFRAGMVPLMIALTAWFLTKSYKTRRWYWQVLSGVSLGLGFYTYISFRMVPLILLAVLVFALITARKQLKSFLLPLLIIGLVTAATLAPMAFYTYKHKSEVLGVRNSVSITNPAFNQGSAAVTLAKNIGKTALMFNFIGDQNYRHNLGGAPMLNAFVGVMFIFGSLLALRRFKDIRYFSLLAIFGIMLLPELLTAEGIPHSLRAVGVLPVVYIFAAVGTIELLARWKGVFPRNPAAYTPILLLLGFLLMVGVVYDYERYFVAWANAPETYQAFSVPANQAAGYINQHPDQNYKVVVDINQNRSVQYLTSNNGNYQMISLSDVALLDPNQKPLLIIVGSEPLDSSFLPPGAKAGVIDTGISSSLPSQVQYRVYQLIPSG